MESGWLVIVAILIAIFIYLYPKYLRKYVFGYIGARFVKEIHPFFHDGKIEIFAKAESKLDKTSKPLKILEIGPGSGCNFKYYPKNAKVTLLDKTNEFSKSLNESIKNMNREDLTIENIVLCKAENMNLIESNSFDMVISTFLICSVDNSQAVYDEIYRVLKNGGVYLFFDHSRDMENPVRNLVHKLVEPLWTFMVGDCKFCDINSLFKTQAKFQESQIKKYKHYTRKDMFQIVNPVFYGYGQKLE